MRKRFNVGDLVLVFLLGVASAGAACVPSPQEPVTPPSDEAGAASCESACANLQTHHCALGEPTVRGGSCEVFCGNVQENNAGAGFNVSCLARVKTCEDAKACR